MNWATTIAGRRPLTHKTSTAAYDQLRVIAYAQRGKKIVCTAFGKGHRHDFYLFKESNINLHPATKCEADTGYQGIVKLHGNSEIPKKQTKKRPLSKGDKMQNRILSSSRVLVENVIRSVKIFRIITEKYRNRRKRFALRFNLIAAIYNLNLIK